MDKQEFALIANAMRSYYPRDNVLPTREAIALWYEELKDLDFNLAMAALKAHVHNSKWAPTIHELRAKAAGITAPEEDDWGKGWKAVLRAVGRYGYPGEKEAMESFTDLTREAVRRLGWKQICEASIDEQTALRANFRMIYTEIQEKKAEQDMLPDALKEAIAEITGKEVKRIGRM